MFRNRGEMPDTIINHDIGAPGGHRITIRPIYIIRYDKNFVLIQITAILAFIIFTAVVYIISYQAPFKDPIEDIWSKTN